MTTPQNPHGGLDDLGAATRTPRRRHHAVDGNVWDTIGQLARRFEEHDTALGLAREEQWSLQVLKIAEETGEASQAVIGARGTNPRKGTTSWEEAHAEVADVAITALVALARMRPDDAAEYLDRHLAAKSERFLSLDPAAVPASAEPS
ncbi:MazG-like family protein [Streptomyces sp. NPDC026665]|uniref:MazG-like family protein n=1 Tax=Streptomyces sp. NPDC026665 TaxID=3154798 RepID=UPI00340D4895